MSVYQIEWGGLWVGRFEHYLEKCASSNVYGGLGAFGHQIACMKCRVIILNLKETRHWHWPTICEIRKAFSTIERPPSACQGRILGKEICIANNTQCGHCDLLDFIDICLKSVNKSIVLQYIFHLFYPHSPRNFLVFFSSHPPHFDSACGSRCDSSWPPRPNR